MMLLDPKLLSGFLSKLGNNSHFAAATRVAVIVMALNSQSIASDIRKIELQLQRNSDILENHEVRISSLENFTNQLTASAFNATPKELNHGKRSN